MKRSLLIAGVIAAIIAAWSVGRVHGQNETKKVIYLSSDQANYTTSVKGVSMAKIWGSSDKGAHATFTKFDPGQDNGMAHAHQRCLDRRVEGRIFVQGRRRRKTRSLGRLPARPGGHKHWSGGDAKEGALFYEESSGKFDLIPVK